MKRVVAIGALLLFALAAFWYWSPLLALRQMQLAAKEMNGAAFNERVDYPRVRESVKQAILDQQAAPQDTGKLGGALAKLMVGRMIDGLVQPETVMQMMRQGKFLKQQDGGSDRDTSSESKKDWFAEREGTNTFIAFIGEQGEPKERRLGLVMERSGFASWRLVGLRVPARTEGHAVH